MNGSMKRKWKIIKWALIWCASRTPEKLVSIFPYFLKFGYLSLLAMAVYLLVCTLYVQDGGLHVHDVSVSGVSNVTRNDRQIHHRDRKSSLDGIQFLFYINPCLILPFSSDFDSCSQWTGCKVITRTQLTLAAMAALFCASTDLPKFQSRSEVTDLCMCNFIFQKEFIVLLTK